MNESNVNDRLPNSFQYQEIIILNKPYLIGVRKVDDIRHILVTDLVEFYEENLSKDDIIKRCEDQNPVLIDFDFEEIVDNLLLDVSKFIVSSTLDDIQLESKIEDGRFCFNIALKRADPGNFYEQFIENFYFSFSELQHRYNSVLGLIKKKDQEIEEYKAQGVELLRKSMITEPFTEESFNNKDRIVRPVDKINTFMKIMNFYNKVKHLRENDQKTESKISEMIGESSSNKKSDESVEYSQRRKKRPPSSNMRCAVAPKSNKKMRECKKGQDYKFL